jgi:acetylglutamate kinase
VPAEGMRAVLANSGNANALTGPRGVDDVQALRAGLAQALGIQKRAVLTASTGVIGQRLPVAKMLAAMPGLVEALGDHAENAAEAIMTTDTRFKEAALRCEVGGRTVTLGGVAKGVGMIEPHLATMFCFVTTDVAVARGALDPVLKRAVDASFNRITVDSDQSTSDTVAVIANGLAENAPLDKGARGMREFAVALDALVGRLARMLVQDGEGATKLVSVTVRGAASRRDALVAARSVANSPLVKTAINGADPNWGRIMMALGKTTARVEQDKVSIAFGGEDGQSERLVERGMLREGVRQDRVREIMGRQALDIIIDLGIGRAEERVWTCDLSEEYVRINGKYTT